MISKITYETEFIFPEDIFDGSQWIFDVKSDQDVCEFYFTQFDNNELIEVSLN